MDTVDRCDEVVAAVVCEDSAGLEESRGWVVVTALPLLLEDNGVVAVSWVV